MAVTEFKNLPLAGRERHWDGGAAEQRIRKWAGAEDQPNAKYRDAHVWYDDQKPDNFGSYKLLIADVIDGKPKVVPRAVFSAGGVMNGARGGVDMKKTDIPGVKAHLAKYYEKLGEEPPWKQDG